MLPQVFAYPDSAHERRHSPSGYTNYQSYKAWLRDEFAFRCVYCLERERWYPSHASAFSVDHVIPQSEDPDRVCDYENLVYACLRCNSNKRSLRLPDPARVPLGRCLSINNTGVILALNADGQDMIDVLHLNDSPVIDTRTQFFRILNLKLAYPEDREIHELFLDSFGYPRDLPNLAALRPPGGNRKKAGLILSYYQLRQLNQLGEVY